MTCTHKTKHDFSRVDFDQTLKRIWTCTACGVEGPWSKGWAYFGNIECSKCGWEDIDAVYCDSCSTAAKGAVKR